MAALKTRPREIGDLIAIVTRRTETPEQAFVLIGRRPFFHFLKAPQGEKRPRIDAEAISREVGNVQGKKGGDVSFEFLQTFARQRVNEVHRNIVKMGFLRPFHRLLDIAETMMAA